MDITVEQAAERRDAGIERSAEHAEREHAEWTKKALMYVEVFAMCVKEGRPFMAEDVIEYAEHPDSDLPKPPDRRAWGAVMTRACREGLIEKVGYAPARTSNLSPKVLWRRKDES